jgi:hypothetical protein
MKILGVIASSVFKIFTDNFNRTTAGSLGTPSGGGAWTALRGVWFANGTKATSSGTATDYPIASAEMYKNDPTILLDVDGNGVGASFWVSDSSNWWGVFPFQTTNETATYSSTCSGYGSTCSAYRPAFVCTGYGYRPDGKTRCSQFYYDYGYALCQTYSQTCTAYSQTFTGYTYSAGSRYLRLIKSVANTVTTVADSAIASAAASIKVVINSGGTITSSAYTSAGQVSQTGSDFVNTPVSPTKGTKHGILLAPGGINTATTVDNLTIK